jgi:hypothetical protein
MVGLSTTHFVVFTSKQIIFRTGLFTQTKKLSVKGVLGVYMSVKKCEVENHNWVARDQISLHTIHKQMLAWYDGEIELFNRLTAK